MVGCMASPLAPPRVVLDPQGRPRLKVKRGRGSLDGPEGPHAHHFSATGSRVDEAGRPVEARSRDNFRRIRWDLDDPPAAPPGGAPNLGAALALANRSGTFRRLLDDMQREGWVIELAAPGFGAGCRKGPNTLSLDTRRRGAFVAHLVHAVAYACALAEPLPSIEEGASGFPHEHAVFFLRRWGHASLHQAIVRDEVLAEGGTDIGGPGLRGLQQEAYERYREEDVLLARVIDALAFSIDGALAADFVPGEGPRVAKNLTRAFIAPPANPRGLISAEMFEGLERACELPVLDVAGLARTFDVALVPGPPTIENAYVSLARAQLRSGPFATVELRQSSHADTHFTPRLLLVPRLSVSHFDLLSRLGPGAPHHIDPLDDPFATVAYTLSGRQVYVTYAVTDTRPVSVITVQGS
jgi:hypothetical protein